MFDPLLHRRDVLHIGTISVATAATLTSRSPASVKRGNPRLRAKSVILLFMDGGPSHIDLFDRKPEAPAEIRGPFDSIATTVPGTFVCEHLPKIANQMHRICQVRSVRHTDAIHDPAVYLTLTGRRHPTPLGGLRVSPDDAPHVGSLFATLDQSRTSVPKVIELPETMKMEARTLPGQNAGFLGTAPNPFRVTVTPEAEVIPPDVMLPPNVDVDRLLLRGNLRPALDRRLSELESNPATGFNAARRQAIDMLGSTAIRAAFDLSREPEKLRDAYGRHRHGQSVLLARRLVEAGAKFVTVYWGREPQDWADGKGARPANNPWDTHRNHFPLTKNTLAPRADQTLSALLTDLRERGRLDDTLVVWMGEFGRTPTISKPWASRDHWPHANTILLAGGGAPGGQIIGRTDRRAAEVTESPVSPADVVATMLAALGTDPHHEIHDRQGRPFLASDGTPFL